MADRAESDISLRGGRSEEEMDVATMNCKPIHSSPKVPPAAEGRNIRHRYRCSSECRVLRPE